MHECAQGAGVFGVHAACEQGANRAREHIARPRLRERRRAAREHEHFIGAFLVAVGDIGVGALQHAYHAKGPCNKQRVECCNRDALLFTTNARCLDFFGIERCKNAVGFTPMRGNNRGKPRNEALAQRGSALVGCKRRKPAAIDKHRRLCEPEYIEHRCRRRVAYGKAASYDNGARTPLARRMLMLNEGIDGLAYARRLHHTQRGGGLETRVGAHIACAHARRGHYGKHARARINRVAHHELAQTARVLVIVGKKAGQQACGFFRGNRLHDSAPYSDTGSPAPLASALVAVCSPKSSSMPRISLNCWASSAFTSRRFSRSACDAFVMATALATATEWV